MACKRKHPLPPEAISEVRCGKDLGRWEQRLSILLDRCDCFEDHRDALKSQKHSCERDRILGGIDRELAHHKKLAREAVQMIQALKQ